MDSEIAFKTMQDAFAVAKGAHPDKIHETYYILAGQGARMRIAGDRLSECIHLPFAHLRTSDMHLPLPHLTIELWDQRETGIPWQIGSAWDDVTLSPSFAGSRDGRFISNTPSHSMTCLDRSTQHIVGCTSNANQLSLYERGRPLHVPLAIWHNDRDVPVIHAGLVSRNGQGVLLAGSRGAGKSTSAITCLCAGLSYLSDDLIGLQSLADGSFVGHSIYGSIYLEADDLGQFPPLRPHAMKGSYPYEDKHLVLLSQVFPSRLERVTTISAVALARIVDNRHSQIRPASKGEALLALAPSSLLVGRISSGVHGFSKLVQLVEHVPCYWLELGRDLNEIPYRVEELLSKVAS